MSFETEEIQQMSDSCVGWCTHQYTKYEIKKNFELNNP